MDGCGWIDDWMVMLHGGLLYGIFQHLYVCIICIYITQHIERLHTIGIGIYIYQQCLCKLPSIVLLAGHKWLNEYLDIFHDIGKSTGFSGEIIIDVEMYPVRWRQCKWLFMGRFGCGWKNVI